MLVDTINAIVVLGFGCLIAFLSFWAILDDLSVAPPIDEVTYFMVFLFIVGLLMIAFGVLGLI